MTHLCDWRARVSATPSDPVGISTRTLLLTLPRLAPLAETWLAPLAETRLALLAENRVVPLVLTRLYLPASSRFG